MILDFGQGELFMVNKLIILDVDGVLTDGTKIYDINGNTIAKRFCDQDFSAIKKFVDNNCIVCWLSADKDVNESIAKNRDIPFWYSRLPDGSIDKVGWLYFLIRHYAVSITDVIYVGDDLFDIPIINEINVHGGFTYCPQNAVKGVREVVSCVCQAKGGEAIVMEIYESMYSDYVQPSN